METRENPETLYGFIRSCEMAKHEKNIRRIKLAIRYFFIIPMILLAAMLMTGSSNIAFLLLWIVSLFSIAAYAIVIEYNDYELRQRMRIMELLENGNSDIAPEQLAMLPLINEKELMKIGIDRESVRTLLAMFNRQRRQRRAERPLLENGAEDAAPESADDGEAGERTPEQGAAAEGTSDDD